MITTNFNNYDAGVWLEYPKSYYNFWNREQFTNVNKAIDIALEHILNDVIRVMKLKGMRVDEEKMTVEVEGFMPLVFVESIMF